MNKRYNVEQILQDMTRALRQRMQARGIAEPVMIGIHTGGVWIAEELHRRLGLTTPLGGLNISFYRDDFSRAGLHPDVKPSNLPFEIDGAHLILVDDVLYTGRTIRAAMNEIFDYGRPDSITLAVLAERSGRELPIQADVVGVRFDIDPHEQIKLTGPQNMQLEVVQSL
ncbi:MAG: bifunctional pyr operon transcriptional regulator/uracil phosphoribosyltransferase PyrR [Pseudomonadota bacterium]